VLAACTGADARMHRVLASVPVLIGRLRRRRIFGVGRRKLQVSCRAGQAEPRHAVREPELHIQVGVRPLFRNARLTGRGQREVSMAQLNPSEIGTVEIERASYIDWPGVFVGMIIASALSWLLLTFGSAIGLASFSPYSFNRETGIALTLAAATWFALTQIYSIAVGAYIAARLRPRISVVNTDEVPFRDGVTGLTVWGMAIVIGLVLTGIAAYGAARTAAPVAGAALRQVDADYTVDRLLRSSNPTQAPTAQAPDGAATREQVSRILLNALAQGDLPQADRDYLAQLIAARAGIPPEEAQQRLNEIYNQAKAKAAEVADATRKATALGGFWIALIMLAAAMASWWAGVIGGNHRDDGI
jgi:hypothetical protein